MSCFFHGLNPGLYFLFIRVASLDQLKVTTRLIPRALETKGDAIIVRYADRFAVGFQYRRDAARFLHDLKERLRRFGPDLLPDKTRRLLSRTIRRAPLPAPAGVPASVFPKTGNRG